jgi:hypothetical protein
MNARFFASVALAAALTTGCSSLFTSTTSPTTTATNQLMAGQWTSVSSTTTLANTCTDFHWTITTVTGTSGSGTFTAKCMGTLQIAGTAHGTLSGTTVTWAADATGATATGAACPVTLAGTATFDGTQFRIPYTGTTCLGPVSGTEILRKP